MADEDPGRPKQPAPPPIEFVRPGDVDSSGTPSSQPPAAWIPRPEDYVQAARPPPRPVPQGSPGSIHLYAGIVLVLAGLIGMGDTIYYAVQFLTVAQYQNLTAGVSPAAYAVSQICGLVAIWAEASAVFGGILAIQRLNWRLAAGCAMFALASIGGLGVLIPEYGLIAAGVAAGVGLVLALRGRPEFLS